jgi:hypothetical protein
MKNIKKLCNLIALAIFMGWNFLAPISYAVDDLESGVEIAQTGAISENAVLSTILHGEEDSITNLVDNTDGEKSSYIALDGDGNTQGL